MTEAGDRAEAPVGGGRQLGIGADDGQPMTRQTFTGHHPQATVEAIEATVADPTSIGRVRHYQAWPWSGPQMGDDLLGEVDVFADPSSFSVGLGGGGSRRTRGPVWSAGPSQCEKLNVPIFRSLMIR